MLIMCVCIQTWGRVWALSVHDYVSRRVSWERVAYPPHKICAEIALRFIQSSEKFPHQTLSQNLGRIRKKTIQHLLQFPIQHFILSLWSTDGIVGGKLSFSPRLQRGPRFARHILIYKLSLAMYMWLFWSTYLCVRTCGEACFINDGCVMELVVCQLLVHVQMVQLASCYQLYSCPDHVEYWVLEYVVLDLSLVSDCCIYLSTCIIVVLGSPDYSVLSKQQCRYQPKIATICPSREYYGIGRRGWGDYDEWLSGRKCQRQPPTRRDPQHSGMRGPRAEVIAWRFAKTLQQLQEETAGRGRHAA